ncbi:MAG TPA: preprotein translocase subunit YajC [Sedimentisphaerales bacterium]|nr:preprotein translocase subunit YajC [Sedimentisphaerales bacterium]
MKNIWILAQTSGEGSSELVSEPLSSQETGTKTKAPEPNGAGSETSRGGPFGDYGSVMLIVLMMVVFYFIMFRGPRKKQQEHRQMVQSLKKNDRVRTIGGIVGTVVDIKGDEVTLKVDESNNTKIKVVSSAIGKNMSEETK